MLGAMNWRGLTRRSLLLASLVVAAAASGVAFQEKASNAPAPKVGDSKVNPKDGLRYLWIPPGALAVGCSAGDKECFDDESPVHNVRLTRGFWFGQTEVTQAAFIKVMGYNSSVYEGLALPADSVSWDEADEYCTAIGGRLPSVSEWEYAARAGTQGSRYGNLDEIGWYIGNSGFKPHPVAQKKPNAFGLYDMLGNVVEWTHTFYWTQHNQEDINPVGPPSGEYRELRGGGWWDKPEMVRASYRARLEDKDLDYNIGFRCATE